MAAEFFSRAVEVENDWQRRQSIQGPTTADGDPE
jgi:hypothetical protein